MANAEHLEILRQGPTVWNDWRREHLGVEPDLSSPERAGSRIGVFDLRGADLSRTNLRNADLMYADLVNADLREAELVGANLSFAKLDGADLRIASLDRALLDETKLNHANFYGAMFVGTNLIRCELDGVIFTQALMGYTTLVELDLQKALGLETVTHSGASDISISTIYRSEGNIPESFLLGCGVTESFIAQIPALIAAVQPIQFYSCFISYSGRDEEFARRLHSRMREAGLRVWFAPEDMKGGDKVYDQIDRAIQVHDRLLLVLSESSMRSQWVETEIRRARIVERREGRQKLFPIRLMSYGALQQWACIDSTTGEDLAEEVRSYFIPDFSNWKNHDDLEQAFARLLADLKASA